MKFQTKLGMALLGLVILAACEKPDETPPRSEAFIREYVLPEPSLLTNEERQQINREREEYENL